MTFYKMFRLLLFLLLIPSVTFGSPKKKPLWTEYEARFHVIDGSQPVITIRWWSMDSSGPYQEYLEIWRKSMKFGYGNRFHVEKLVGVDHDGKKKKGQVVIAEILDTKTKLRLSFRSDKKAFYKSYSKQWMEKRLLKYPSQ